MPFARVSTYAVPVSAKVDPSPSSDVNVVPDLENVFDTRPLGPKIVAVQVVPTLNTFNENELPSELTPHRGAMTNGEQFASD